TTLFNAIAGDQAVTAGRVRLAGRDVTRLKTHRRAALGVGRTFQITTLFPGLTVEDNVRLAVRGRSRRKFAFLAAADGDAAENERVESVLERSRLTRSRARLTRTLSYGEQRELELALALARRPGHHGRPDPRAAARADARPDRARHGARSRSRGSRHLPALRPGPRRRA